MKLNRLQRIGVVLSIIWCALVLLSGIDHDTYTLSPTAADVFNSYSNKDGYLGCTIGCLIDIPNSRYGTIFDITSEYTIASFWWAILFPIILMWITSYLILLSCKWIMKKQ